MPALQSLSTSEAAETDASIGLVPTGSTEQHGPALPLGTDTIVASDLVDAVADDPRVLAAPPIPIGVSPHHRHFDGTLWVDEEPFRRYVEQVVRSFASQDIDRVILVNGHGGNVGALTRVGQRLRAEETAYAVCFNWWEAADDVLDEAFEAAGGHAGHGETSMMYAVDSEHVREEQLAAAEAGAPPGWGKRRHGADVGFDTVDFTPTGAVGMPTDATPEVGERIRERALEELDALLEWLASAEQSTLYANARPMHPDS